VWDMQTICRCYLSEQLSILGWLFVTTLYYNLSLPYRVNVFQHLLLTFFNSNMSLTFYVTGKCSDIAFDKIQLNVGNNRLTFEGIPIPLLD
jgi:hypothetical protein